MSMGTVMATEIKKKGPTASLLQTGKPADLRKSVRLGGDYRALNVYCVDSNDMRTFFCFWITD